ncbi:MAG: hypothetical protein R3E83_18580 [Burkholderiaceae bacterium]
MPASTLRLILLPVVIALLFMPMTPAIAATARLTVPAPAFLALLQRHGVGIRVVAASGTGSACEANSAGRFRAKAAALAGTPTECVFSLSERPIALRAGWSIERLHWSGDLRAMLPPVLPLHRLSDWQIRIRGPAPASTRGFHEVRLVAVVIAGPVGRPWEQAFER